MKNETSVAHNQDGHHLSQLDAVGEGAASGDGMSASGRNHISRSARCQSCRLYPPEIDMAPAKGLVVDYCPC